MAGGMIESEGEDHRITADGNLCPREQRRVRAPGRAVFMPSIKLQRTPWSGDRYAWCLRGGCAVNAERALLGFSRQRDASALNQLKLNETVSMAALVSTKANRRLQRQGARRERRGRRCIGQREALILKQFADGVEQPAAREEA